MNQVESSKPSVIEPAPVHLGAKAINPKLPRTFGDGIIPFSDLDLCVEAESPLYTIERPVLTDDDMKIGQYVASMIPDGATLQIGIGAVPDAVLRSLTHHKDLGIHSEMWTDGALELIKLGVVTNTKKKFHIGKTVATFLVGSQDVYDFVHDNPAVLLLDASYVNNPTVIARNPKVIAINSAVEVDLSGQVCADSIGHHIISGVGGQVDFIRGAALSIGGKPIIALPSRTSKGIPRIVTRLHLGAGVVTTRAHTHFVVTEYGIAELFGKTLRERARALIAIAHPEDRENLDRAWYAMIRE